MNAGEPAIPSPSLTRAPAGNGRRVLLVRAIEEPFNPLYYNHVSLGLLWIVAGLRRDLPDVESRILEWDCLGRPALTQRFNWYDRRSRERIEAFGRYLDEYRPAVVGISAYSSFMPLAIDIARTVRRHDPAVPVVLGGFHASAYPRAVGRLDMFDWFVRREGVRVFPRLVRRLLDGVEGDAPIHSLSWRGAAGEVRLSPLEPLPADLDQNPPIAWEDVDLEDYRRHRLAHLGDDLFVEFPKGRLMLYEASQGCGHRCRFCEQGMQHGLGARHHSPARVVADLERIRDRFDSEGVFFTDEHMHQDRAWFEDLLSALSRRRDLGLKYTMAVKADEVDTGLIDRIIDAGFVQISTYPESGSARIRRLMGKPLDIERHLRVVEHASRQGVIVFCGFVVGWPGESREEVEQSYAIAGEGFIDFVHMLPLVYLGRSAVGRQLARLGVEPGGDDHFRLLNRPTSVCLAGYGSDEFGRYVDERVKALNRAKLDAPATRAKFERLGWRLVRLPPEQPDRPPTAEAPAAARRLARLRGFFERMVLPAVSDEEIGIVCVGARLEPAPDGPRASFDLVLRTVDGSLGASLVAGTDGLELRSPAGGGGEAHERLRRRLRDWSASAGGGGNGALFLRALRLRLDGRR